MLGLASVTQRSICLCLLGAGRFFFNISEKLFVKKQRLQDSGLVISWACKNMKRISGFPIMGLCYLSKQVPLQNHLAFYLLPQLSF